MMPSLLLVEDDPIMGESLQQRFQLEGWQVEWVRRLGDVRWCASALPNSVISDVRLPDGLATRWFAELPSAYRALPWVFLTGYGSVNEAVEAIRAGARDYLTKPFDIERLVALMLAATASGTRIPEPLLGISTSMRRVESMIRKVALQKVSVLLMGESGVGKEVAARLIHELDPHASRGEFMAVNCAAVPETMMEAEFFGYERGAFSGAQRAHRGFLERASGGTLFLDEIGDLPASMQAKLLRALQERAFFRLGSEALTMSDFRIVAATNRDLHADMAQGKFREDLFYRIAVVTMQLPPLRQRPEDIPWLAQQMLEKIAIEQGRSLTISDAFVRELVSRPWRGNVRELRSFLEQAAIWNETGTLDIGQFALAYTQPSQNDNVCAEPVVPLHVLVAETERQHIRRTMTHTGGNVSRSAELLGISRKTLWEKMKKLGV
jgi:DNA-binding NtrC family response regulator